MRRGSQPPLLEPVRHALGEVESCWEKDDRYPNDELNRDNLKRVAIMFAFLLVSSGGAQAAEGALDLADLPDLPEL